MLICLVFVAKKKKKQSVNETGKTKNNNNNRITKILSNIYFLLTNRTLESAKALSCAVGGRCRTIASCELLDFVDLVVHSQVPDSPASSVSSSTSSKVTVLTKVRAVLVVESDPLVMDTLEGGTGLVVLALSVPPCAVRVASASMRNALAFFLFRYMKHVARHMAYKTNNEHMGIMNGATDGTERAF